MSETEELLASFVRSGCELAFRELVTRYIDLVYSTAVRLVDGDAHRAQDVTQVVFADLARMAAKLSPGAALGGWLHRHSCFVARSVMRGERRRRAREREAAEMNELNEQGADVLARAAPFLDGAIEELGADDRTAIVLRFFERRSLRSVGEALGINENVAQKRVARAVEELGKLLVRQGVTFSAAALAGALTAGAVQAAPAGLAISVAGSALASVGSAAGAGLTAAKVSLAGKLALGAAGAIIVAGLISAILLRQQPKPPTANEPPVRPEQLSAETDQNLPTPGSDKQEIAVSPSSGSTQDEQSLPMETRRQAGATLGSVVTPPPTPGFPRLPLPASGRPAMRYVSKTGGKVRIDGTSSRLGAWRVEGRVIGGFLENPLPARAKTNGLAEVKVEAFIPVRSLKSVDRLGKPYSDKMDDTMYQTLKSEQFPRIYYRLLTLSALKPATNKNNVVQYRFDSQGELVVAGTTNPIAMLVTVSQSGNNGLEISGSTALKMTSFHIQPPSVVLGAGRVADNINITFTWMVEARRDSERPAGPAADVNDTPVASTPTIPAGTIRFINADLRQVLAIYGELAQSEIEIDERVASLPSMISFPNAEPVTRAQATALLDDVLLEQAGILVTHPETNRATMQLLLR